MKIKTFLFQICAVVFVLLFAVGIIYCGLINKNIRAVMLFVPFVVSLFFADNPDFVDDLVIYYRLKQQKGSPPRPK